jgi:predicted metal-dependent HD superfamily phosphohydrolase
MLETVWSRLPNPYLLSWSLWFHDYYYEIGNHDNEERNGILSMRTALEAKLSLEFAVQSSFLIFATEKHELLESPEVEKINMQIMLDIDLSILAKPWQYYLEYAKNIREEYKQRFSWEEFSVGRASILEKFLKRDVLFHYPPFRDLFENRAQANLEREINILRTMKEESAYGNQA